MTDHDNSNESAPVRTTGYSWAEFFNSRADGEVWVQNVSDMQISLAVENPPGDPIYVRIPAMPDPYPLTDMVGFDVLKKSSAFRKALSKRRPNGSAGALRPELLLLDSEQAHRFFTAKARAANLIHDNGDLDVDGAMALSEKERLALTTMTPAEGGASAANGFKFAPPKSAQELIAMDLESRGLSVNADGVVVQAQRRGKNDPIGLAEGEVIKPQVLHLCHQVHHSVPISERMPEAELLRKVQQLDATLTMDDWQYLEAHGYWPKVKKHARRRIAEIAQASGEEADFTDMTSTGRIVAARADRAAMVMPAGDAPVRAPRLPTHVEYQGPVGFANAPFAQMANDVPVVLGPNGEPL